MATNIQDLERALVAADEAGNAADAKRLAQAIVTLRSGQHTPVSPLDGMSEGEQMLAGAGKALVDIGRGAKQMALQAADAIVPERQGVTSLVTGPTSRSARYQQEIDEIRRRDAPLMESGAGATGNIGASMAAALPALAIPGANTVAGAAALGGVMNALQPTSGDESRLANIATGAALGGASQAALGKLAGWAGKRLADAEARGVVEASRNAVKDATLQEVRGAGYVVPPSLSGGGTLSRLAEGASGKIKAQQLAATKNQNVTETLARKAMGMADDAPITVDAMKEIRAGAYSKGYEPLVNAGPMETGLQYQKALDGIVSNYQGAARSFGKAVNNEVTDMVDSLRVGVFDTGDALKMTRILRDDAGAAFASGDKAMGKAKRAAADAIEDQIERGLEGAGKSGAAMLKEFRDARTLMAKSYDVEKSIREGGAVDAKVFGRMLQKGRPLTGDLRTIGLMANNFPDVAGIPRAGWANPVTALDAFGAAGMAGMGMGPLSVALPAARLGARHGLMSPAAQARMAPSYGPGAGQKVSTKLLEELERRGIGGLLGSVYAE